MESKAQSEAKRGAEEAVAELAAIPFEHRTFTVEEVGRIRRAGKNAVYEAVRTGALRATRTGALGKYRVTGAAIVEWIAAQERGEAA